MASSELSPPRPVAPVSGASTADTPHAFTPPSTSPAGSAAGAGGSVPVFQCSVKRSTRFTTTVPATEVLLRIKEVIDNDPHPLPSPFTSVRQQTRVVWNDYRLEVHWGGIRVCTVQIYLVKTGLYIVEFTRGQLNIFDFKRFYTDIREHLSSIIKHDGSLQFIEPASVLSR